MHFFTGKIFFSKQIKRYKTQDVFPLVISKKKKKEFLESRDKN